MAGVTATGDEADSAMMAGRPFRGRLDGLPYRYAPADDLAREAVSVVLGSPDGGGERRLDIPVPTFVAALESAGRPVPLAAAAVIGRCHARDRVPRSRIARWRRAKAPAPPAALRHLWHESRTGEDPAAFVARHAPPGRPPTEALVRRILASDWAIPDHDTLRAALSLPLDWFPETREARADLACLAHGTASVAAWLGHHDFLLPSRGRFDEFRRALAPRLGIAAIPDEIPWLEAGDAERALMREGLRDACTGVADMFTAFSDQVALPILLRHGLGGTAQPPYRHGAAGLAAARVLAGDKGLLALLDLADHWHARLHAIDAVLDPLGAAGGQWSVPFDRVELGEGIEALALSTPAALRAEGGPILAGGLGHCVGTYAAACAAYRSVIVSIRRAIPDGSIVRLSTVELANDRDGYRVAQHRGAGNGPPPPEAEAALPRLLERLADGANPSVARFLEERRRALASAAPRETGALAGVAPYWRDGEAIDRVHAAWGRLLPRPLRDREALERAIREAAAGVHGTWRPREGRFYAPAAFGLLAQGYRPWSGPERAVPWTTRLAVLGVAPVFVHDRIEAALRLAAWRRGRPGSEERWGGAGRLAARGAPALLVLAVLVRALLHCFGLLTPGWTAFDAFPLFLAIARDVVCGYLALCLPAHLLLQAGRLMRPRDFGAPPPSTPAAGAYLPSRHEPSGRDADGGRDASRLVPQVG